MPYKRLSRVAQAFSIPQNHAVFVDIDFFNTHAIFHSLLIERLSVALGYVYSRALRRSRRRHRTPRLPIAAIAASVLS
jgi:hypothetical protein